MTAMIASNSTFSPAATEGAQTSSATLHDDSPAVGVSLLSERDQLLQTLHHAARTAGPDVSVDDFMQLAWEAFVSARPGLRERIADAQLIAQIRDLRQQGRVGQA
jgi:hypothetical protein